MFCEIFTRNYGGRSTEFHVVTDDEALAERIEASEQSGSVVKVWSTTARTRPTALAIKDALDREIGSPWQVIEDVRDDKVREGAPKFVVEPGFYDRKSFAPAEEVAELSSTREVAAALGVDPEGDRQGRAGPQPADPDNVAS
jgi:hypothetical protein